MGFIRLLGFILGNLVAWFLLGLPARSDDWGEDPELTHGVFTVSSEELRFFGATRVGAYGSFDRGDFQGTPGLALGGLLGFEVTGHFRLEASFLHQEETFDRWSPSIAEFGVSKNTVGLGGKFLILGGDSRIRPFFGGGLFWSESTLAGSDRVSLYGSSLQYLGEYSTSHFGAYGEVGAQIGISERWVVQAALRVQGPFLYRAVQGPGSSASLDPDHESLGNSLSQGASYTLDAGVGIYF